MKLIQRNGNIKRILQQQPIHSARGGERVIGGGGVGSIIDDNGLLDNSIQQLVS